MKEKKINYSACEQNPLQLFADMPAMLNVMHKIQESLHAVIWHWVDATNYKRVARLLNYNTNLMKHTNNAMRVFVQTVTWVSQGAVSTQENKTHFLKEIKNNLAIVQAFTPHADIYNALQIKINTYENILLSEEVLMRLLRYGWCTHAQKLEIVTWYINFFEELIRYNALSEAELGAEVEAYGSAVVQRLHAGDISYETFKSMEQWIEMIAPIEDIENGNLAQLKFLYEIKRNLLQEIPEEVWV